MQDVVVDGLDRRVVNALQVSPRASWAQIGAVLEADPVTVARRWQRMRKERIAWITAYPGSPAVPQAVAMVEVECSGSTLALAEQLVDDPECFTIDITSGGRDILLTVAAESDRLLTNYLLTRLGALPAVRTARTHVVTQVLSEASSWRLRELTDAQRSRLAPRASGPHGDAPLSDVERSVLAALAEDGRMPPSEIAVRTGLSVRRARETVAHMLSTGRVILRTEMNRALSGWPVYAWYFLRVPAAQLARVGPRISRLEEVRTVMVTAGPSNLMAAVWMRELTDVARLEAAIEDQLDGVQITDRSIVLRTAKLVGAVLDADGRRTRSTATVRRRAGSDG